MIIEQGLLLLFVRLCGLRTAQFVFGEGGPLAVLVLLFHKKRPGLVCRIPRKGIVKRSVGIFKDKFDGVSIALAVTKRL